MVFRYLLPIRYFITKGQNASPTTLCTAPLAVLVCPRCFSSSVLAFLISVLRSFCLKTVYRLVQKHRFFRYPEPQKINYKVVFLTNSPKLHWWQFVSACCWCKSTIVGQTVRQFTTKVEEHRKEETPVFQHITQCGSK